jgi:hypothetical protein
MGYTHYWTPKATDDKTWKEYVAACKKLYKELPLRSETAGGYHADDTIMICGWDGTGKPEFKLSGISFNGDQDRGFDHETFSIEKEKTDWNFCKTARKPYDLLVCACLIAAKEILGYEVSSDGDFEDWQPAIAFYMDTFYAEAPDREGMKAILPKFLFDEEDGTEWFKYENKYNIMDYINSLFVKA